MIGLTLEEGKHLLAALQVHLVQAQAEDHSRRRRRCQRCGALRPVKDQRSRQLVSLFGTVEVRVPRFTPCRCAVTCRRTLNPVAEIMPDRCTPEYERTVAKMGSLLPYRRARTLLAEFLPLGKPQAVETTRQRTLRVGTRLEQEAVARAGSKPSVATKSIALSIDGGHVRAARQNQGRTFEVLLAQVSNDEGKQVVFASVPAKATRPSRTWGWSGRSPKRTAGPTLGDGMVPVERAVHDGGPHFQHQMSASRRPAHLLLCIHSPMQQPLHRALGDRRRNRFFASARCRVVDDDIGLSRHICLEIAQKARHLARGGGQSAPIVGRSVHCNDGFGDEIQRPPDLAMPQTPADPLDGLGEASTSLAISLRGVGPALGRLSDVLNPHREMKPVEHMVSWTRAGGFAERSRTVGTIAQDGDRCRWCRAQPMKHTAQLSRLRNRLRRHAGEHDLLSLIVADLGEENLERAPLVLTSRPHMAAVNGERNRFRRHRRLGSRPRDGFLLQPGADTKRSLPGRFHGLRLAERQKLRQQRPGPAVGQQGDPSSRRPARTPACIGRA